MSGKDRTMIPEVMRRPVTFDLDDDLSDCRRIVYVDEMTVEYAVQGGGITHPLDTLAACERYAAHLRLEHVEASVVSRLVTSWEPLNTTAGVGEEK